MSGSKAYFDLVVCVPLEIELTEVYRVFEPIEDHTKNFIQRFEVSSGLEDIKILVVAQDEMGRSSARRCVASALADFDAGLVVCLGIAGGLSNDLSLGSVCYSGTVVDVYDNAKVVDLEAGLDTAFAPTHMHTDRGITSALNFLRSNPKFAATYSNWQGICAENATAELHKAQALDLLSKFEFAPRSLNGTIACGQVSDSKRYNDKLKKLDRKILAIETESGGVFAASEELGIGKCVTIRGISDYAEGKLSLEDQSKGAVRHIAAFNAASFLKAQLENSYFIDVLKVLRGNNDKALTSNELTNPPLDLAGVVRDLEHSIDVKLRELSPEYKFTEKGYSLPIPRIKPVDYESTYRAIEEGPAEIEDVLMKHDSIVIDIPRTYPDDSLSWVIAHSLITSDINRQQILPFVIEGKHVFPPASGFHNQSGKPIEFLEANGNICIPVFIIDNPPLHSRTRSQYLIEECKKFPGAKFIFVVRGELDLAASTILSESMNVEAYTLCPISLKE